MLEIFQVGDVVENTEGWMFEAYNEAVNPARMVTLEPGDVGVVRTTSPYGVSVLMLRTGMIAWIYHSDLWSWRLVEGHANTT